MSLYSKQKFFCNACGKEVFCECAAMLGGGPGLKWRVCSSACLQEIRWRETLSIMGKEYYPDPHPYKEE